MDDLKEREIILDKILKLQALQQSAEKVGSLEEAANAAEKIQRLLIKYNLDLTDAEDLRKKPEVKDIVISGVKTFGYTPKEGFFIPWLGTLVAEFFFCRSLNKRDAYDKELWFIYVGTPPNIQVAINATTNLVNSIRAFGRIEWRDWGEYSGQKKGAFLRSYYAGVVQGLNTKLRKIKEEREAKAQSPSTTMEVDGANLPMVLVNQLEKRLRQETDDYVEQNFRTTERTSKAKPTTQALIRGYQKGLTLSPQDSLSGSSNKGNLK